MTKAEGDLPTGELFHSILLMSILSILSIHYERRAILQGGSMYVVRKT